MQSACFSQRCHWAGKKKACSPEGERRQRIDLGSAWKLGVGRPGCLRKDRADVQEVYPVQLHLECQWGETCSGSSRLSQNMSESVALLWNSETCLVPGEEGERGSFWPPQLKWESMDRARKWSHLPGVEEQSEAWDLPVRFRRQSRWSTVKGKAKNSELGC